MANKKSTTNVRAAATRSNSMRKRNNFSARNNREKKMICAIIALAILLIGSIGVALAAFSTDLYIRGTATVRSSVWNIHFDNLQSASINGDYAKEITKPTIQTSVDGNEMAAIKTYDVELKEPGDSIEYTFDVVNGGDIDAKLASITINTGSNLACTSAAGQEVADKVCANLSYTIKHADGSELTLGEELPAGTAANTAAGINKKTLKLKLELNPKMESKDLPEKDVAVSNLAVILSYDQNVSE